ncbi:MAG: hypothetical protein K0R55_3983 [Sporomusa sp.]|nr:hypothetical protein [Sporomusa sp.]
MKTTCANCVNQLYCINHLKPLGQFDHKNQCCDKYEEEPKDAE